MYIIVTGGGRTGYYLLKALLDEGHEVLVIEKNAAICDRISEEVGSVCFRGDGCETTTLEEVGTSRADMFIAVTGDDEDNLVSCQVAKQRFKVPRTIARIRNPQNETLFKKLGVDVTVSSTNLIIEHIEEEVPTHPLIHLLITKDKEFEIVEVKIPPNATTIGKSIKELSLPSESVLSLIIRKGQKPQIPTAKTILQAEDQLIAATAPEAEIALRAALTGV